MHIKNFLIYRVAPRERLLTLGSARNVDLSSWPYLARGIFFSTQKKMALDASGQECCLFQQRGEEFLEALKKLPDLQLVLLNRREVGVYQTLLFRKDEQGRNAMEAFLQKRTFRISPQVSLRMLAKAIEVVVILPPNISQLPLQGKGRIDGLSDKTIKRSQKSPRYHPGTRLAIQPTQASPERQAKIKELKKLEKQLSNHPKLFNREAREPKRLSHKISQLREELAAQ